MTHPAPVDLPPMPAKTTCEVKFTDKAQIGQTVTMPFGHTDEALTAYAQIAINEAVERERSREIEWRGKDGTLHYMPLRSMVDDMRRVYDDWLGGLDELESSLDGWKRKAESTWDEALERAAVAALDEKVDADETGHDSDKAYNMALDHAAAAIRALKGKT